MPEAHSPLLPSPGLSPVPSRPSPEGTILALDIGGTKVALGLYDPRTDQLAAEFRFPVQSPFADLNRSYGPVLSPEDVAQRIEAFVRTQEDLPPITRVSVSLAAAPSRDGRSILYAPNLPGWEGEDLVRQLEQRFTAPAHLIQDGHATTLGELHRGHLRGVRDGACVTIGTGIGGGIVVGGTLMRGANGLAGVGGYIPVSSGGRIVPLEQAVAGPAFEKRAHALGLSGDASAVLAAAGAGHSGATDLLQEVLGELAQGLAALVSLLNPERVVLAGSMGLAYARYIPTLARQVRGLAQPTAAATVEFRPAALAKRSALWGAVFDQACLPRSFGTPP